MDFSILIGKTISRAATTWNDEKLLLFFSDGSSTMIDTDRGYDNDVSLTLEDPNSLGDYDKVKVGLLSEMEYKEKQNQAAAKRRFEDSEREKQLYQSLKRKYENIG